MLGQLQVRMRYRAVVTVHLQLKIRIRVFHGHQKTVHRYGHTQLLLDFAAKSLFGSLPCLYLAPWKLKLVGNVRVLPGTSLNSQYSITASDDCRNDFDGFHVCKISSLIEEPDYLPAIWLIMPRKMKPWKGRTAYQ